MDAAHPIRTARRSASHNDLRSSHSLRSSRPPPSGPFHKPLRRVNENVNFLASPGPLGGMLKTTTETGDIGIFSIGPHLPQSRTFHQFPRSRTGISERNRPRTSDLSWRDRRVFQDDRRRLPSYRDTTSEILSLYGSESQRSGTSSPYHRFEDGEPRSYSMTSCGSRQALYSMPNGAGSPHLSSGLQRPRSPFPYPTRLKRPGFRPSSPALTENGNVDYSRMVGIDRVSYRTVHGSYKPFYTTSSRRPHRPSFRSDRGSPMGPGHDFGTYQARHPRDTQSSQYLTPSWEPSSNFRDRAGSSSSYQSPRTSSLTSIYDNYRGSPLAAQQPRVPEPSSLFYYDYTEGFEDKPEQMAMPAGLPEPASGLTPVSIQATPPQIEVPVPRRGPGALRPMVLQEDCDAGSGSGGDVQQSTPTPGPGKRLYMSLLNRPNRDGLIESHDGDLAPFVDYNNQSQYRSPSGSTRAGATCNSTSPSFFLPRHHREFLSLNAGDGFSAASPSLISEHHLLSEELSAASKSPERRVEIQSPGKATIRSVQATILGYEDQQSMRTSTLSTIVDQDDGTGSADGPTNDMREGTLEVSASYGRNGFECIDGTARSELNPCQVGHRKVYSVEASLSDLASLVNAVDRVGDSPARTEQTELDRGSSHSCMNGNSDSPASSSYKKETPDSPSTSLDIPEHVLADGYKSVLQRHRRNQDEVRGNIVNGAAEATEQNDISPARMDTPMLAPKPLSPAKELRLQNSIPQLMKALPPLPAEQATSPLGHDMPITDTTVRPINPSTPSSDHQGKALKVDILGLSDYPDVHQRNAAPNQSPKFKIRLKSSTCASNSTLESRPWNKDKNYPWIAQYADIKLASGSPRFTTSKPRLKLNRSRIALETDSRDETGTVKRNAHSGLPPTISEIARGPTRDLFSSPAVGVRMFPRPPSSRTGTETPGIDSLRSESRILAGPPCLSDGSDSSPRGASLDTHTATDWMPRTMMNERGDLYHTERGNIGKRRALRQKLSNLRKKVDGSPLKKIDSLRGSATTDSVDQIGLTTTETPVSAADASNGVPPTKKAMNIPASNVVFRARIRRRLSRWMDGAKQAVRAYVAKRRGRASSIRRNQ